EGVPDELFDRCNAHRTRRQYSGLAVDQPGIVNERDTVSHSVDEIDEVIAHRGFREPVRIFEPGDEARGSQGACSGDEVARLKEEIEIFRLPVNAGVFV